MNAREAVRLIDRIGAKRVVPLHFEGWTHFREGRAAAAEVFRAHGVADRVVWPTPGETLTL